MTVTCFLRLLNYFSERWTFLLGEECYRLLEIPIAARCIVTGLTISGIGCVVLEVALFATWIISLAPLFYVDGASLRSGKVPRQL